jgi:hypothetical protein
VRLSRLVSVFLLAFGVWSWVIWPTFLKNIAADPRSWAAGTGSPTGFFLVHLVLTVVSIILGTIIGIIGIRGLLALRRAKREAPAEAGQNSPERRTYEESR